MNKPLRPSRLPQTHAKLVLVSGEYPQLTRGLEQMDIIPLVTAQDKRLPLQVAWHPDMQACELGGKLFVLRDGPLSCILGQYSLDFCETNQTPGNSYPSDAICNVLSWGQFAMGNLRVADRIIRDAAADFVWISVKQGYAACSTALVDKHTAITADNGVASQLERHGIETLRITPGHILLPGYSTGFFGGCCGKIAPDVMAFAGQLESHPDGQRIRGFLRAHNVREVELFEGSLLDVGGLLAFS